MNWYEKVISASNPEVYNNMVYRNGEKLSEESRWKVIQENPSFGYMGANTPATHENTQEEDELAERVIADLGDNPSVTLAEGETLGNTKFSEDDPGSTTAKTINVFSIANGAEFSNDATGARTINYTGDEPVDITLDGKVTFKGKLNNVAIDSDVNAPTIDGVILSGDVIIENLPSSSSAYTIRPVFTEGEHIIQNNTSREISIQSTSTDEPSIIIISPNTTVNLNGTNIYNEVTASTAPNTLKINGNLHINKLFVNQGNVLVKTGREENIANIIDEYTLAPGCSIDYLHDDITNSNAKSKLVSEGTHNITEDLNINARLAIGILGCNDNVWNLNGHNITSNCGNDYWILLLRGSSSVYINGEGTIRTDDDAYGFWTSAENSKLVVNGGTYYAATHVLYAEKGTIEVNGGEFHLTNTETAEKDINGNFKFLLNCKDDAYTAGTAKIIVRGGKYYGFNPAESYGEPGAPISYVAEGYESIQIGEEDGLKIYEVRPVNQE